MSTVHPIDARGLACPEPVVLTQQAAATQTQFSILVDNNVAVQNITRFCNHKKLKLTVEEQDNCFCLHICKP